MYRKQMLNGVWKLSSPTEQRDYGPADVPGSVYSTWLKTGEIEDPFWRTNEYALRERMTQDFVYERTFSAEDLSAEKIELVCEGLDTVANIRINDVQIADVNDMHRTYRFDVKSVLKKGSNHIRVYFSSALNLIREEDRTNDIHYASTGCLPGNAVLRKAHYMFGWDWGPQLPDCGIFRDIYLEYTTQVRFEEIRFIQKHEEGRVRVQVLSSLNPAVSSAEERFYNLQIKLIHPDGKEADYTFPYQKKTEFTIDEPQLWWPNGVGEQPLYRVSAALKDNHDTVCDKIEKRIGLRTVTVCTDAHDYGSEFCFVVNGVKIFAMGANYVPQDNLIPRVTAERYRRLVEDSKRANFNCIRVWGGGYYPDEAFYDACDEAGILIWQDLMFACNVYRLTDDFEQNIVGETIDIVKRLRDHACMGLWCGNNEMEWGWGDMWARIQGHHPRYKADYIKIFEYVLPKTLKKYDDVTYWWPSSPSSGGDYDDPNGVNRGDQHYWEVWHSGKPFTEYRKNFFTFCSEYGFQSFPGIKTIEEFTLPEDRNIFTEVMESHQKNRDANGKILNYVSSYFLYPKDLSSLAYISQILQLKAIQYGVEHWRQNRGRCMGSLYWQLNDCWPVASWASVDYYGRWKALHYGAKRFYRPVMISACEKEELSQQITYYVHNDTREALSGTVKISLKDNQFGTLWECSREVSVSAMTAAPVLDADFSGMIPEGKKNQVYAYAELILNGQTVSCQTTLFVKPKHYQYPAASYQLDAAETEEEILITVRSDCFAQYLEIDFKELDLVLSDNYFDLVSEEGKTVSLSKKEYPGLTAEKIRNSFTLRSVKDTYQF